jgi:hypothetical protein
MTRGAALKAPCARSPFRLAIAEILLAVSLIACGSEVDLSAGGGDGALDCIGTQVERTAHASVEADTEAAVVAEALEEWTDAGGTVVESGEFWYVIVEGRDVAIALPEQDGGGSWAASVTTCGDPETGPAPIDGVLDCADDRQWIEQAGIDGSIPGLSSADAALREVLEPYQERLGGEITTVDESTGSLVVEQREQIVATAIEVPAGGWVVSTTTWCMGFVE